MALVRVELRDGNDWCQAEGHHDFYNVDRCVYVGEYVVCLECIVRTSGDTITSIFQQEIIDEACLRNHSEECCQ